MIFKTADLYDLYGDEVRVAFPIFNDYGGKKVFFGPISTVKVYEDNSLVRKALEEDLRPRGCLLYTSPSPRDS